MGEWLRDPEALPLWANSAIFIACALVVWVAGGRTARYCKTIAHGTRAGQALVGALLLGAVVSLPELVVATTAALLGKVDLAVNTLIGGIAATMAAVAVADLWVGGAPVAARVLRPVILVQGCMVMLLLLLAAMGFATGEAAVGGVGAWSLGIALVYVVFIVLIHRLRRTDGWAATWDAEHGEGKGERSPHPARSELRRAVIGTVIASLVILVVGAAMTYSAAGLSVQTGLGPSFMGLVFGGIVTSLPELSASISASKAGQHDMVYADIFGSNLLSLALLLLVDACAPGERVFSAGGQFALLATLLGAVVTCIGVMGLVVRPRARWLRGGPDSVLMLAAMLAGYALIHFVV